MYELLSYNIQYGKNLDKINGWISQLPQKPDIICYQEYPEDQLNDVNPGYKYAFARGLVKNERTYGELTAYKSDKFTLTSTRTIDLSVSNLEKKVFGHSGQRSALLTIFKFEDREFMVANLHLLWLATHNRRRSQIAMVIDAMDTQKPALIVGDFNYSSLVAGTGLTRYLSQEGFLPAGDKLDTHKFFGVRHQVDYLFQRNCSVAEVRAIDVNYSDHLPVFVKFDINK